MKSLRSYICNDTWLAEVGRRVCSPWLTTSPSVIIIGAQKAGTTALFKYLAQHPQIRPPRMKEVRFFSHDHRYCKGELFYRSHFSALGPGQLTFDATPAYMYFPQTAERIQSFCENVKIICLVRDPVSRAFSQWNMYRQMLSPGSRFAFPYASPASRERLLSIRTEEGVLDFEDVVEIELDGPQSVEAAPEPSLVRRGLYADQLRPYFNCFEKEQIRVYDADELKNETQKTLDDIFRFIGVSAFTLAEGAIAPVHAREYAAAIAPQIRKRLETYFEEPNREFCDMLGREFRWC